MDTQKIYHEMGISSAVLAFCCSAEEKLKPRFAAIDAIAEYNQAKVVAAMQKNRVSAECFAASTGYGYNDIGREALEKVYADTFHTEAALVRPQITCGTHALALALAANLRPGDELYSPVGRPYDTLEEVIGIRPCKGSLAEFGITYRETELLPDGTFDYENIRKSINEKTKLVTIQRSKGYATRPSFSVDQIGQLLLGQPCGFPGAPEILRKAVHGLTSCKKHTISRPICHARFCCTQKIPRLQRNRGI